MTLLNGKVKVGLEVLLEHKCAELHGRRIGLLLHGASYSPAFQNTHKLLKEAGANITCLFGPQHGLYGETQDNMIEWEGGTGTIPVYSLYGKHRKPTPAMLSNIDTLVIDLQDVGVRFYTYIWTMFLCMQACAEAGKRVIILDRPNPIGGEMVEGPSLEKGFETFLGLAPIPVRHGLTIGELALYFGSLLPRPEKPLIVKMEGWRRAHYFDETGLPWFMPSPNMPTLDTAIVYPGFGMIEGTNLSEGRGTTRPFEIIGAPYIDPDKLVMELDKEALPGIGFRPLRFQPAFDKWQGQLCGGFQLHVTNRKTFSSCLTLVAALSVIRRLWPEKFDWRQPPFEYEETLLPFDMLAGGANLRKDIENGKAIAEIVGDWEDSLAAFRELSAPFKLYD